MERRIRVIASTISLGEQVLNFMTQDSTKFHEDGIFTPVGIATGKTEDSVDVYVISDKFIPVDKEYLGDILEEDTVWEISTRGIDLQLEHIATILLHV